MNIRFKAIFKTLAVGTGFLLYIFPVFAQDGSITLEECYRLARANYPLIKKQDLINSTRDYTVANASKLFLPKFSISGQATYQSETFSFPTAISGAPGISLPTIDKDQYRIQCEITQSIFDAGISRNQKEIAKVNAEIQSQQLETDLYSLKDRISQIYFSILLIEKQLKQNELRKSDLQSAVDRMTAALQNGTAYRSTINELKAELSSVESSGIEFRGNGQSYLKMLSLFTGTSITNPSQLVIPSESIYSYSEIKRPELSLFEFRKQLYNIQEKQLSSEYLPHVNAFFQGAYGRPTLNIIENKFDFWYIGGVRLNWSLGSLYTLGNNKRILNNNRQILDTDKETFVYNTNLALTQLQAQIKKYEELINEDEKAIGLREAVSKSAKAQLDNGVITVSDYIARLNAENLARQTQILHNIQLLQVQYNLKNISGN